MYVTGIGLTLEIDGEDLVCASTQASYFGDQADVDSGQDNGVGCAGFRYIAHPEFLGVALPMKRGSHHLSGSPIPGGLPTRNADGRSGIEVRIQSLDTKEVVTAELVDLGPTGGLNRGLDMLPAVVTALGLDKAKGLWNVRYRIIGGAKFLPR